MSNKLKSLAMNAWNDIADKYMAEWAKVVENDGDVELAAINAAAFKEARENFDIMAISSDSILDELSEGVVEFDSLAFRAMMELNASMRYHSSREDKIDKRLNATNLKSSISPVCRKIEVD
jgi:hypothetical protein